MDHIDPRAGRGESEAPPTEFDRRTFPPPDGDQQWRTSNVGRFLFAATRVFVADKLRVVRAAGARDVSEAMMALLLNLDREGTRLTTLALRAGQTKQSMIELVDKAEAIGLVERRADPDDLRAKWVRFTGEGDDVLGFVERGIAEAEARFAGRTGARFVDDLRRALSGYVETSDARAAPRAGSWRQSNVGRLLALAGRRFVRAVVGHVRDRGHAEVSEVLLGLFRQLDLAGTRLTELAARAGVTKQSMRELILRAEALGWVERRPDPSDQRAKIVAFTPTGLLLLEEMRQGVALAEAAFARATGERFTHELKERLTDYLTVANRV